MPAEIEQLEIPPGARLLTEARRGRLRIPAIPVRQEADQPPKFIRSRFGWNMREVSGSLGDLGTFLPHIVGAITWVVKDGPDRHPDDLWAVVQKSGCLLNGVPMAVQPMKAASAAVLIEPMDPAANCRGGSGLRRGLPDPRCHRRRQPPRTAWLPRSIAAGLQLGLGMSLAGLGILRSIVETQIWLGLAMGALMLGLMRCQRVAGLGGGRSDWPRYRRRSGARDRAAVPNSRLRPASAASRSADLGADRPRHRNSPCCRRYR